ncbi:type VI secretion system baseplate subunit TssE [Jannaschia aquimarina]|uniref:type VI secretion system baseplate subunit TssE n=1 Tax=Jannaschia aquimarina TaxID=935700 RepID=UPI0006969BF7|nr:GPW/gp25 family protein [Jannaschia aquimarina]
MSLTHVFRDAAETGMARRDGSEPGKAGDLALSQDRRMGVDEGALRRHLAADLDSLVNTIRLDAFEELDNYPRLMKSVLNYGFAELGRTGTAADAGTVIAKRIRESLITFEPRLIPESVDVQVSEGEGTLDQRLVFDVTAEIAADPADLPLDFVAEVDLGAGKMKMKRLKLQK